MRGYKTKAKIEGYLHKAFGDDVVFVDSWISSIEKFIENYTGRIFIADKKESSRVYDGKGGYEQKFDEFIEIIKVEIGEDTKTEVVSGDYRIYPNNQENKHTIQLKSGIFSSGYQNITITAKWGYSEACPDDIELVATILTAGITNFDTGGKGKIASKTVGKMSVSYDTTKGWADFDRAMKILDSYKTFSF